MMDTDALIRVLASIRTDLNGKILALSSASTLPAAQEMEVSTQSLEFTCAHLGAAVGTLNQAIKRLGGKA